MTSLPSVPLEEPRLPTPRFPWFNLSLRGVLCALLLTVVGGIFASVSPTGEGDRTNKSLAASELDLTAGDPLHNQAIQILLVQLERNGYQINGTHAIGEDRWSVLRGRQSVFSPNESQIAMEWRMAVCSHPQAKPHSYLALRVTDQGYTPELTKAIETEWLHYSSSLPGEIVATAQTLLAKMGTYRDQDRDSDSPCDANTSDASVVMREWREGGMNSSDAQAHYCLRLKQLTPRYEVAVELHDDRDRSGNPSGCWLCIDFVRLAEPVSQ